MRLRQNLPCLNLDPEALRAAACSAGAPRPRLHLIRFHGVLAPSSTTSAMRPDAAQPRQFRRPGEQGRWDRLRPRVRGTDGGGLETRDNPQQAPKKDAFRLDRLSGRRPTHLSPHPKTGSRRFGRCVPLCSAPVLPCSGSRREAKRAFEKPILTGRPARPHPTRVCGTGAGRSGHRAARCFLSGVDKQPRPRSGHHASRFGAGRFRFFWTHRVENEASSVRPPFAAPGLCAHQHRTYDLPHRCARHCRQGARGDRGERGGAAAAGEFWRVMPIWLAPNFFAIAHLRLGKLNHLPASLFLPSRPCPCISRGMGCEISFTGNGIEPQ